MNTPKSAHARLPRQRDITDEQMRIITALVRKEKKKAWYMNNQRADREDLTMPRYDLVHNVASSTAMSNMDADNLFQVLPEMELAAEIVVSAVLSPGDMVTTDLDIKVDAPDIPAEITGPFLRRIKDEFEDTYKIKDVLYDIVMDVLFKRGSYSLIVLPETSIDNLINSDIEISKESLSKVGIQGTRMEPYGLLGPVEDPGREVGLEALLVDVTGYEGNRVSSNHLTYKGHDLHIELTDNPDILKVPTLIERKRSEVALETYRKKSISLESARSDKRKHLTTMTNDDIVETYYRKRKYLNTPISPVLTPNQLERKSVGSPVVINPSNTCLIPVFVPGNRRQHVAYLALIDGTGNFLELDYTQSYWDDTKLHAQIQSGQRQTNAVSNLLEDVRMASEGRRCQERDYIKELIAMYGEVVDNQINNSMRNGAITGNYEVRIPEEVLRLMVHRSLHQKKTKMLYVPAELLIYIAVDYNHLGVGKSLIENGKTLGVLRSLMLFAGTNAAIKNATDSKVYNIEVDEDSDEPLEDVMFLLHEVERLNPSNIPLHTIAPLDMADYVAKAGRTVNISGSNKINTTTMEISERQTISKEVDMDLMEDLKERHLQTFGLTSGILEAASGVDFATQVVTQNLMLLKRVLRIGDRISPHLGRFVRTYTSNHGGMIDDLMEIIRENKVNIPTEWKRDHEGLLEHLIASTSASLPRPEADTIEERIEAYNTYREGVTAYLDAYFYDEMATLLGNDEMTEKFESMKACMLNMLSRSYLVRNNIIPELEFFETFEESKGPLEEQMRKAIRHAKKTEAMVKRNLKQFDQTEDEGDDFGDGGGDDMGGGDDDMGGSDDMGGDDFGGDDFGGGDDTGEEDNAEDDDLEGGDDGTGEEDDSVENDDDEIQME